MKCFSCLGACDVGSDWHAFIAVVKRLFHEDPDSAAASKAPTKGVLSISGREIAAVHVRQCSSVVMYTWCEKTKRDLVLFA